MRKSDGTTNVGPSSKKEDRVGDMKLPTKGGVMMRLTSMMDDNDDGLT